MNETRPATPSRRVVQLWEIAKTFLTIGTIGFGGGMAIIAMIQDYCVVRRRWLVMDEFAHGIAFGQILGPFAVNASIFVGYRLRGLKGAVVAAISFLFPSVTLVIVMTALYARFHHVPSLQAALKGIGPVVVALILAAAYQTGSGRVRSLEAVLLMISAVGLIVFLKLQIVVILLIAAAYGFLRLKVPTKNGGGHETP
jgi:chromate transporter